jgi:hypothetical protein
MRRKFSTWLPGLIVFVGGALAMKAGQIGVFADRSRPQIDRGTVGAEASDGSTTSTTFDLAARVYRPGDCVRWDQSTDAPETRVTRVVPCDEPHLIEMTGRAVMPVRKDYPTDDEWNRIIDDGECGQQAAAYLDGEIDPYGRFMVGAIKPTFESWIYGDREMWCGVQVRSFDAHFDPNVFDSFTGAVRSQPQWYVHPAGTCLAGDAATRTTTGRVPCNEPHIYEVAGDVDAGKAFSTPPAADSSLWNTKLIPACTTAAKAAFGGRIPAGVEVTADSIDPASWRTGQRRAECDIARYDADRNPVVLTAPLLPAR